MVMVLVPKKTQMLEQSRCRQSQSLSLCETTYKVITKLRSCGLLSQDTKKMKNHS